MIASDRVGIPAAGHGASRAATLMAMLLAVGMLGAGLLVDPRTVGPFEAPKWWLLETCIAIAVLCMLWNGVRWRRPASAPATASLAALSLAAIGVLLAAWLADAPSESSLRRMLLLALLLPLGASRLPSPAQRRLIVVASAAAIGINALVSLLQWAGVTLPALLAMPGGGRYPTGALLGNEGLVAIACATALPACAAALVERRWRARLPALGLMLLCLAAIVLNRQLTALLAGLAGALAVVLVRIGSARWLGVGLLLGMLVVAALAVPPVRANLAHVHAVDPMTVQQRTTYRLGGWLAAEGMWRARPWFGHGPGSYRRLSQHYRLEAELAARQRFAPPATATGFGAAHNEYLQFAAENGVPALLAALLAGALLVHGLLRRADRDLEAAALLGTLITGALAALAWFPLQVPLTAAMLLLAAGRGWRLLADGGNR